MFKRLGLTSKFNLDDNKIKHFLNLLCQNYNFAPFHNMTHAFNVTHVMYWIIRQTGTYFCEHAFEDVDKFAMLVACMGHDINHPGLGNTYFVKANHPLSLTVNGSSVLENFHCFTLFRILEES